MILSTHTPNPKLTSYRWQGAVFHFLKALSGRSFLSVSKTNTSPQQSSLTERAWLTCRKRPYLQGPRRAGFRTHRLVSGPCQTCQHKTRREQAAGTFPSVSPQDLRCCQGRAKGATLPFFPPNPHTSEEWRPPHLLQNRQQECAAAYLFCERKSLPADCHLRPPSPDSPVRFTKFP